MAAAGDLREIPPNADCVLELAHVRRAREGSTKPVITCFYTQHICLAVFRHKKAFALKHAAGPLKETYKYQLFKDLMGTSFKKMRALAADDRVAAFGTPLPSSLTSTSLY
jgi:hypothetical protein